MIIECKCGAVSCRVVHQTHVTGMSITADAMQQEQKDILSADVGGLLSSGRRQWTHIYR